MSKPTDTTATPYHREPLVLEPEQVRALRQVVDYALREEHRHWQECGRPKRHIYRAFKTLSRALKRYPDRDSINIIWITEDVLSVRPDLTKAQAREVLQAVPDRHDANYGVTWDTLHMIGDELYGRGGAS